jgi:rod shape-determining protein MreC
MLDAGRRDGIANGGAVLGLSGLLGRVVATGETTSRVQLVSDRTAATGVFLPRSGRGAVARGDGVEGVALQYVPAVTDIVEGDIVVSAGTDGVYPRDVPVGKIASVGRTGRSLFLDLPVHLAADPHREPLVFVFPPALPRDASQDGGLIRTKP